MRACGDINQQEELEVITNHHTKTFQFLLRNYPSPIEAGYARYFLNALSERISIVISVIFIPILSTQNYFSQERETSKALCIVELKYYA